MCFDDHCTMKNGCRKLTLFLSFFNTVLAIALLSLGGVYTSALQCDPPPPPSSFLHARCIARVLTFVQEVDR